MGMVIYKLPLIIIVAP